MKKLTRWWQRSTVKDPPTPASVLVTAQALGAESTAWNPVERSGEWPVICIVTPVFDGADYIDDTIFSVLSQAGDFELHYHVQDGGSRDDTMVRVRGWMERSTQLPLLCRRLVFTCASAPDTGMYDAINRGFAVALPQGDDVVMGWIAADDRVAPGACATLAALRVQVPDARLLGGRIALLDQAGSIICVQDMIPFSRRCMAAGLYDGRMMPFIMQEGTFWCADLWRKVSGLDQRFRLAGDWDLWRRMAEHETYVSVDGVLGFHRRRPGQLSGQMDRYYEEVDATLDDTTTPPITATVTQPGTDARGQERSLRATYDRIAVEQEAVRRDPPRFRASQHAATAVRYNLHLKRWERLHGLGLVPGAPKVIGPAGSRESRAVSLMDGFKPPEGPYPEYGLRSPIHWMSGPEATGEVWLDEPGVYRIAVRCRSWTRGQNVVFLSDGKPLGRIAVTPYEHDRDLELMVDATLAAGHHVLGLKVEQSAGAGLFLLVMEWCVEQVSVPRRTGLLPVPEGLIALAARVSGAAPAGWPRVSIVVYARDRSHVLRDTLTSIVRQGYPNLELIVVDSDPDGATHHILRDFTAHIGERIVVPGNDENNAINAGLTNATGDVLGWLCGGDLIADGGLHAAAFTFLQSGADMVVGICQHFDDGGRTLDRHIPLPALGSADMAGMETHSNHIGYPAFFTRALWDRAGGSAMSDGAIWARMAHTGPRVERIGATVVQSRDDTTCTLPDASDRRLRIMVVGTYDTAHRRLANVFAALGYEVFALVPTDVDASAADATAILAERPDLIILAHPSALNHSLLQALAESGIPIILSGAAADLATPIKPGLRIGLPGHARLDSPPKATDTGAQVHALPVGVDTLLFDLGDTWRARMLLGLPQDAFVVLTTAAETGVTAGLSSLIAALGLVDCDTLVLLVMGAAAPVAEAGFPIHYVGTLPEDDLRVLHYQAADLFIASDDDSSDWIVEAAACGRAAIGGPSDAAAATIVRDVTGIVVETRTPGAIAEAIGRLRADPVLRHALEGGARLHAVNRHGVDACASRLALVLTTELHLTPPSALRASPTPIITRTISVPGGTDRIDPIGWIPRTNLIEERPDRHLPGLPPHFWWAVPPECSFMVRAGRSGVHTLQLRVRNELPGRSATVYVNNGAGTTIDLAAEDFDRSQAIHICVDLDVGLNRVVVWLGSVHDNKTTRRNLALIVEDVKSWPGVPSVGNEATDGAYELIEGFGVDEGPYPDMALPNPFHWVTAPCCEMRVFSAQSVKRRWVLKLRNNNPDQILVIAVDGERVGSTDVAARPLHTLQHIEFEAVLGVGFHTVTIVASRLVQPAGDPRSLAFIFEAIAPCQVATQIPTPNGFAVTQDEGGATRWLCASGFSVVENGPSSSGAAYRMTAREAVIRFSRPIRHVHLLLGGDNGDSLVEICSIEGRLICSWQPGTSSASRLIEVRLLSEETRAVVLRAETAGATGVTIAGILDDEGRPLPVMS